METEPGSCWMKLSCGLFEGFHLKVSFLSCGFVILWVWVSCLWKWPPEGYLCFFVKNPSFCMSLGRSLRHWRIWSRSWTRIRVRIDIWEAVFHSFTHATIILWALVLCQTLCYIFEDKGKYKYGTQSLPRAYSWMEVKQATVTGRQPQPGIGEAEGVVGKGREEGRGQRRLPRTCIIW